MNQTKTKSRSSYKKMVKVTAASSSFLPVPSAYRLVDVSSEISKKMILSEKKSAKHCKNPLFFVMVNLQCNALQPVVKISN